MSRKQAQQNYCHHVAASGNLCRATPLRDEDFCYFHMLTRERLRRRREADRRKKPLTLPIFEDTGDIQLALTDLGNAVLSGALDPARGYLVLSVLQTARKNHIGVPQFVEYNSHYNCFDPRQLHDGTEPEEADEEAETPGPESLSAHDTPAKAAS